MTTLAMISDMLPLALALDPGSEAERSLGTVVIGGLTSSLLLVPIVYLRFAPPPKGERVIEREGQLGVPPQRRIEAGATGE